jgi:ribosomal protein S18 acetylase RimI-like enzyme
MVISMIRNFQPDDAPQIVALQARYTQIHPGVPIIPGAVYMSPAFDQGRNIFCACAPDGQLLAYAPLFANLAAPEANDVPHTLWLEIKVDPGIESPNAIKDALLDRILLRTREILRGAPEHIARLVFQYLPQEQESIAYVQSRGWVHVESVFQMGRDLAEPIPAVPVPQGVCIAHWRLETDAEQRQYVEARNQVFPEAPTALADWQYFMASPLWAVGTTVTAFDGEKVVGSVAVFWDEVENRKIGQRTGFTEHIFVLPEWRKRGIARYLVREGLVYLKEHGMQAARLEVRARNDSALGLYRSLGYRVEQESLLYERTL